MSKRPEPPGSPSLRGLWIIGTVAIVIGLALVIALAHRSPKKKAGTDGLASSTLLREVKSIPDHVFEQVGTGTATAAPEPISAPALKLGSKPELLYIGAEYCPYCATDRWPLVVALSRFGSFTKLKTTHSSSVDAYPNTATFSFHRATYQSKYLAFTAVELATNQFNGSSYPPLDKLTAAQTDIFRTYTQPQYAPRVGGIPFLDFGGRFLVTAASYDPGVLQGKSALDIAVELGDPTTAVSKGAVGVANLFTAAICRLTDDQPGSVCATSVISRIEQSLSR